MNANSTILLRLAAMTSAAFLADDTKTPRRATAYPPVAASNDAIFRSAGARYEAPNRFRWFSR